MLSARDVIDAPHFSTKHWPSFCDVTLTFKKAIRSDNGQWLKLDECTYKHGEPVASMQVKEIMTHGLITASLGDDLTHLMRLMTRHRVRHMPVLHNGKLAGIISIGDVVKHRLDDLELEASVLRDVYMASHLQ